MSGAGHPTGCLLRLLRAESAAVALVMALLAWHLGPPWWLTLAVLIGPDLALAGYARDPRLGAALYNSTHTYLGPALLAVAGLVLGGGTLAAISVLWALHIAVDRALGFGLKYATAFGDTHLGRMGSR